MICTLRIRDVFVVLAVYYQSLILMAQAPVEEVIIPKQLQSLDADIQKQRNVWKAALTTALSDEGKQTPEWWTVDERFDPLSVNGQSLLNYARKHPGTPESLICLAYIVDWGEGQPSHIFRAAADEIIAHHKNDPALSWICSRCANPMNSDEMWTFLTRLRRASTNPVVQAAATFHLARLHDVSFQIQFRIPDHLESFETAGAFEARPDIRSRLQALIDMDPGELASERDRLLSEFSVRFADAKPWLATRTWGRLNYEFHEDDNGQTFKQLADELSYETTNLRVGCIAPDFTGTRTDGQPFRLQNRRGKPTLLMFSFKGCGPCEAMYPSLRTIQKKYAKSGFSVIGIMVDEEKKTVTTSQKSGVISWPCIWEGRSGPIAETYKVRHYPTVLLLDNEGQIVATDIRKKDHLIAYLEEILKSISNP